MKKPTLWKGCLGCLGVGVLAVVVFYFLLLEPERLFGSRTRFMAHWDHKISLPGSAQILSRESGGNFMDGHITTVVLVPNKEVPAILAQVKPSARQGGKVSREGTALEGSVYGKQEGSDALGITVKPDAPGVSRLTITTMHD
jgi:hypothetical protein